LLALQGELAAIPPRVTTPSTSAQLALQRDQRIAALGTALQGRIAWDRILREVSSVLPDDVWLTQLSAVSPGVAPPAPPPPPPSTTTSATDPTQTDTTQTPATTTPPPAPPSAPLGISGYTYSQEGVARLLGRLALIPELENVKLGSSTRVPFNGRFVYQFSIQAGVRAQAAAA
jgi:Tfp pilus assembly protein PilN